MKQPLRSRVERRRFGPEPKLRWSDLFSDTQAPESEPKMATTIVHLCDRCSTKIERNRTALTVECGPLLTRRDGDSIEICGPCSDALATWLSAPALAHEPARSAGNSVA